MIVPAQAAELPRAEWCRAQDSCILAWVPRRCLFTIACMVHKHGSWGSRKCGLLLDNRFFDYEPLSECPS